MTVFSIRNTIQVVLLTGLLTSLTSTAHAYDLGPVKVHGFLSQGYILSSDNNVHAADSADDGSFEFNEIGLNASYQFKDSIVFSGQLISRDLGDEGNNDLYIDYLQADIQFTDWFGTRLGRFKMPMGFYNQTRDIDLSRPTVFLPQSIYLEAYRPMVASATGGLIYGNIYNEAIGDIGYEFFYGIPGEDDDSCLARSMEIMLQGDNLKMDAKDVYGGKIEFTPPIEGLRLGLTITYGTTDLKYTETVSGLGLKSVQEGSTDPMTVASIEYSTGSFTFATEYMYNRQRNTLTTDGITTQKDSLTEAEGFYISGSYQVTDKLETALYWENFYRDKNDKHGKVLATQGGVEVQAWHRAWVLAVRYDITDWWLIKAEGHIIDGAALTSPHYNDPNELEEHWNILALKTTFSF